MVGSVVCLCPRAVMALRRRSMVLFMVMSGGCLSPGITFTLRRPLAVGVSLLVASAYVAPSAATTRLTVLHNSISFVGLALTIAAIIRRANRSTEEVAREIAAQNAEFERNNNGLHYLYTPAVGKVPPILWLEVAASGTHLRVAYAPH